MPVCLLPLQLRRWPFGTLGCSVLLWLLLLLAIYRNGSCQVRYRITDLGTLGGATCTAYGMNAAGHVVGTSEVAPDNTGRSVGHAFLFGNTGLIDLGLSTPSDLSSVARGVNDSDEVVGAVMDAVHGSQACWWRNGHAERLTLPAPTPPTKVGESSATGINNHGDIVGTIALGSDFSFYGAPFVWRGGIPTLLSPGTGGADSINDSGQVVGRLELLPALWDQGSVHYLGNTPGGASGINSAGAVVGATNNGLPTRAWVYQAGTMTFLTIFGGSVDLANSINSFGQIVGAAAVPGGTTGHAYLYANGAAQDLNALIPGDSGWQLTEAVAINDAGQIAVNGFYKGQQRACRLDPTDTQIDASQFRLTDRPDDPTRSVVGIVCDNLRSMAEPSLDRLIIQSDYLKNATILDWHIYNEHGTETDDCPQHHRNVGTLALDESGHVKLDASTGSVTYYPPDEFNYEQEPMGVAGGQITPVATRSVKLYLRLVKNGTKYEVTDLPILLARPPIVLVHGINSSPLDWSPLDKSLTTAPPGGFGIDMPLLSVNHHDNYLYPGATFSGNGAVEVGADLLSRRIKAAIGQTHGGGNLALLDEQGHIDSFTSLYFYLDPIKHMPLGALAAKRVDVVAWSYGGVITRWYLASGNTLPSLSWYKQSTGLTGSIPATPYGNDIRKVITLGSMWRGVPLANYRNEVVSAPLNGISLGQQPLNLGARTVAEYFKLTGVIPSVPSVVADLLSIVASKSVPTNVPSMEVLAVNSPWLSQLLFETPDPSQAQSAKPFEPEVAYGSVAGDNNSYSPLYGKDAYTLLDDATSKDLNPYFSWFPYFRLERRKERGADGARNYSDGMVPLWSSAIPGSYQIAPCAHSDYPSDPGTQTYVLQKLNDAGLLLGATLNQTWNQGAGTVASYDGDKQWSFESREMAPHVLNDVYQQIGGTARINPTALRQINTATATNVGATSAVITWVTASDTTSEVDVLTDPFTVVAVFKDSNLTKIHRILLTGLAAKTAYFYRVASTLPNSPDEDILFVSDPTKLAGFTTSSSDKPDIYLRLVASDLAAGTFDLVVTNLGGPANKFKITGASFTVSGYTFARASGRADLPGTWHVTYNKGTATASLYARVTFQSTDVKGNPITGSSSWQRLK